MTFERSELPCGIRVVTERLPGQRSVSLGAWVGTGSRDETPELAGATHFLEHLVFKGTPTRTALDIAQAFDAVGGDVNGFTTKELTCFHARTLEADLPLAVGAIADMLQHALLEPDDVEAERNVVLEEIAMHEDASDDIVFDLFQESVLSKHPLGRRVQGYPHTVEAMSRDAIHRYYRARYTTRNLVISAAGAIDHERLVALVDAAFPASEPADEWARASAEPTAEPLFAMHEREIEQVHVVYGTTGIRRSDDRRWALGVMNVALGGGMSSRLFQEIREKRGLAYSISSGHQAFAETGLFSVYAGCSPENVHDVLSLVRDQLAVVSVDGITEEEVARAIGHLRGNLLLSLDDNGSLMTHLGKSELCMDEILTTEEMIDRVEAVTVDDVRAVAREVLGGRWSLTVLGPPVDQDLSRYIGAVA